jgi:hypothetical protein
MLLPSMKSLPRRAEANHSVGGSLSKWLSPAGSALRYLRFLFCPEPC